MRSGFGGQRGAIRDSHARGSRASNHRGNSAFGRADFDATSYHATHSHAVRAANPDPIDYQNPQFFAAPWLVPLNGEPPRQLPVLEVFGAEYVSGQMSWSPDGQYLLVHNKIYDLDGNLVSPDYHAGVHWLPNETRLLVHGDGLWIVTIAGEPITQISAPSIQGWAFSHDNRYLAYAHIAADEASSIVVYDLEKGTSRTVLPHSASTIRWSADDRSLILGTYGGEPSERPQITIVSVDPPSEERVLIDYAELIEVVPYPPTKH